MDREDKRGWTGGELKKRIIFGVTGEMVPMRIVSPSG